MFVLKKSCKNIQYLPKTCLITVRWATKPRWVPTAKTKLFRVLPMSTTPPDEMAQSKILFSNYRCIMKSVLNLMQEQYREQITADEVIQTLEKEKEDAWQEALRLNDMWNREIATERELRDKEAFDKEVEEALKKIEIENEARRLKQERTETLIREQKELSKSFITPENIDIHIEKILSSPPNEFSFAIDLHGNIYDGFSSTPTRSVYEDKNPDESDRIVKNVG